MTEQGEELPGVTIQYKNNPSKGVITDVDGNFRMDNVPANTVLVFTYIGYAPQELVVNGNKTKQKIALKEERYFLYMSCCSSGILLTAMEEE